MTSIVNDQEVMRPIILFEKAYDSQIKLQLGFGPIMKLYNLSRVVKPLPKDLVELFDLFSSQYVLMEWVLSEVGN